MTREGQFALTQAARWHFFGMTGDSSFYSSSALAFEAAGFMLGAALLWLGSVMRADTRELGRWTRLLPQSLSLLLMTLGLWWPSHGHAQHRLACFIALGLAAAALPLANTVARLGTKGRSGSLAAFGGFAACLIFLIVVRQMDAKNALGLLDMLLTVAMAASLMLSLTALHVPAAWHRVDPSLLRPCAAVVGAMVMTVVALDNGSTTPTGWMSEAAVLVLLLVVCGTVIGILRHSKARLKAVAAEKDREALDMDPLTKLSTRRSFEAQLRAAAKQADTAKLPLAVLLIDLDGFKAVNESFGHADGDRLLIEMANRLRALMRPNDVLARVGADEMLLLMRDQIRSATVTTMADNIVKALTAPYDLQSRQVALTCSVGVARYPKHGPWDQLIARADAAARGAKRAGGGRHITYDRSMDTGARERLALIADLRAALERREFELYYQPKVDSASLQITAAEALVRWHHPTKGLVGPGVFIPVAEQSGLIKQLGDWVIEDACQQAARWRAAGLRMRVAINLSAIQLREPDLVERIVGALRKHRIEASQLTCEITESVAMADTETTQRTFDALGRAGIHLSIDDFGTGYSSLAYLRRLPAEEVKIDRSFVLDLEQSEDARAVAEAVVKLAHALGKKVVAEGVETTRQAKILRAMGANQLQGYLFGKPMSATDLQSWALNDHSERTVGFRDSLFLHNQVSEREAVEPVGERPAQLSATT